MLGIPRQRARSQTTVLLLIIGMRDAAMLGPTMLSPILANWSDDDTRDRTRDDRPHGHSESDSSGGGRSAAPPNRAPTRSRRPLDPGRQYAARRAGVAR